MTTAARPRPGKRLQFLKGGGENAVKSGILGNGRELKIPKFSPSSPQLLPKYRKWGELGEMLGKILGKSRKAKGVIMKKINYKGRCEKRKVSKCKDICRTYTKIQSAFVNVLEEDDEVVSFECNV